MEPRDNRSEYERTLDSVGAKLDLIAQLREEHARRRAETSDVRNHELALQEFIADSRKRHAETTAKFNALLELERQLRERRGK